MQFYPFFCDNSVEIKTKYMNLIFLSLLPPVTNDQTPNASQSFSVVPIWKEKRKPLLSSFQVATATKNFDWHFGDKIQLAADATKEVLITRLLITLNEDIIQILCVNS